LLLVRRNIIYDDLLFVLVFKTTEQQNNQWVCVPFSTLSNVEKQPGEKLRFVMAFGGWFPERFEIVGRTVEQTKLRKGFGMGEQGREEK
jgi:hypothetical protein